MTVFNVDPTGKLPQEKPTTAEFGQFISYLASHGITGRAIAELSKNKKRMDNSTALKEWLKIRPKSKQK
jgi:hypothetical protein